MTEIEEDNVCQTGEWVTENRFRRSWAKLKRNKAALVGGVLAVAVLFFFLRNISLVLIVAVTIPVSVLISMNLFYALGV